MSPRNSSPALLVTLKSRRHRQHPIGQRDAYPGIWGHTVVECGLVCYVVRDSVLSLKPQLRHGPASRTGITTAVTPREYHA